MTDNIKLPLTSADLTEGLLAQLRDAVPQIFSEGKVDFTKLQAALGDHIDGNPERYSLTWAGKREAFRNVQVPSVATLRPQPEESVNWDSSENLIIEGDNLEVHKLLQKPYHNKVKMIYIDPPYNTGNEFIYPDNFREGLDDYLRYTGQLGEDGTAASTNKETSGRYHSNWLNMMYPRLFLARNLLKEDGVIFVSIDDHEVHNLRMLMDEVFGGENFVGSFVWEGAAKNDSKFVSVSQDYILCFSRNYEMLKVNDTMWRIGKEGIDKIYEKVDELNGAYSDNWQEISDALKDWFQELPKNDQAWKHRHYNWVDSKGIYFAGDISAESGRKREPYDVLHPATKKPCKKPARGWPKRETLEQWIKEGKIHWGEDENSVPKLKRYLHETEGQVLNSVIYKDRRGARKEFNVLMGGDFFDNPKDVDVLSMLVVSATKENNIVRDFFAGSGTTAHAVLDLNQQDGGKRKFILVQLPEKTDNPQYPTIAHITRERVRRVITKLQESRHSRAGGNPVVSNQRPLELLDSRLRGNDGEGRGNNGAGDLGFRAFKLDSSNFKIWRNDQPAQTPEQLAEQLNLYTDNVLAERGEQDRLYELILKCGMPLSARVAKVSVNGRTAFSISDGNLLICLEQHLDRDTLRALFARKPQMVLCLDVAFDGDDALKTNTVLEAQTHGIIFKTV